MFWVYLWIGFCLGFCAMYIGHVKWMNRVMAKHKDWRLRFDEMTDRGDWPNKEDLAAHFTAVGDDLARRDPRYWKRNWNTPYPLPPVAKSFKPIDWQSLGEGWPRGGIH